MKRPSKKEIKESFSDLKNYIYVIPVVVPMLILTSILFDVDILEFPYDNVRYAYSAIFQGFAAILAIMITAILITLQNIHAQRFSIEERIYKILGNRYPDYLPKSINKTEKDVRSKKFEEDFLMFLENEELKPITGENPLLPLGQRISSESQVRIIINELRRKFDFLGEQHWYEKRLGRIFKISLGFIIVVIIYSLTALILSPSNPSEMQSIVNGTLTQVKSDDILQSPFFIINPIFALIICTFLVFLALMIVMQFMVSILNVWKLKAE